MAVHNSYKTVYTFLKLYIPNSSARDRIRTRGNLHKRILSTSLLTLAGQALHGRTF